MHNADTVLDKASGQEAFSTVLRKRQSYSQEASKNLKVFSKVNFIICMDSLTFYRPRSLAKQGDNALSRVE